MVVPGAAIGANYPSRTVPHCLSETYGPHNLSLVWVARSLTSFRAKELTTGILRRRKESDRLSRTSAIVC